MGPPVGLVRCRSAHPCAHDRVIQDLVLSSQLGSCMHKHLHDAAVTLVQADVVATVWNRAVVLGAACVEGERHVGEHSGRDRPLPADAAVGIAGGLVFASGHGIFEAGHPSGGVDGRALVDPLELPAHRRRTSAHNSLFIHE